MRISYHIRSTVVLSTMALSLVVAGCGKSSNKGSGGSSGDEIEDIGEIEGNNGSANETDDKGVDDGGAGKTGIRFDDTVNNPRPKVRNYVQFLHTYTGLLDLDPLDTQIANEFSLVETNLPTSTNVTDFLGSHQLSLLKFGSYLCERAYSTKSAEERQIIFGLDPTAAAPIDAFGAINVLEMAKTMMARFWGVEKSSIEEGDANLQTLAAMVTTSMAALQEFNGAMNDADRVRLGTTAMCTAALTSAQVSFYGY